MTRVGFHPTAWLVWLASTALVAMHVADPFASVVVLCALGVVATGFAASGPEGRAFRLMLKVGAFVIAARVVLFGLTGHTGPTTIVTLPELSLPVWLGGLRLGGRVTAEVLAHEVTEGLRIAALLASFGVFLSVVRTHQIVRMLPRFLADAGLVIAIALAFVPIALRTASDVRDAQRVRGHRFRGARSLRALVVPVLGGALERALLLAASMEARGFGRGATDRTAVLRARLGAVGALMALSLGGASMLFGAAPVVGIPLVVAALLVFAWSARTLGAGPRTRFRPAKPDGADLGVIVAAAIVAGAAVLLDPGSSWYPYPVFRWPGVDPVAVLLGASVAAPAWLDAVRGARLRRASAAAQPIAEHLEAVS